MFVLLLLLSVPLYYAIRYLLELIPLPDFDSRAVFVTGCDTGFGRLLALKLARHGLFTFAGCLTEQGQRELREEAERVGVADRLRTVPLDVTSDASVNDAAEHVRKELPSNKELWALVNNAGMFGCYGPDAWTSMEDYKLSMEVNCWGTVRCTHAFLPLLKRSKGRIVSISSVAGRVAVPCGAPYSVAKYGVEAYMDAIRLELYSYGITCSILEPGMFRTNLIDSDAMTARVEQCWQRLSPEMKDEYGEQFKERFVTAWNKVFRDGASDNLDFVVGSYYHAITARFPRARYRCGWDAILLHIPFAFLPTWLGDWLFRYITRVTMGKPIVPAVVEREEAASKKVL